MEIGHEHMHALMKPKGVIIVGATDRPNSVGKGILDNIVCGNWSSPQSSGKVGKGETSQEKSGSVGTSSDWPDLPYKVFPVNPKRKEILGFRCYQKAQDIDPNAGADMAVICVPAKACPEAIRSCGELGSVRALVIIAAGFKEIGAEGLKLEEECITIARKYNMGITGPNCLGIQAPNSRLNASFSAANATPGHIAFISQSGAICTAVLDWSLGQNAETITIGFSAFVSLGSMAHVEWADWIGYCGEDPETDAIIMYMETVGNAERFLKAAQKVAKRKPIVVIKAGKSEEASAAAASHTGSLTGAYGNFLAAMDRVGCIVLDTIDDLQNVTELLSSMSLRRRTLLNRGEEPTDQLTDNIIIVTNAGGPGVLCADAVSEAQLKLCSHFPESMVEKLNKILPSAWSHNNPIDILGDADEIRYRDAVETISLSLRGSPQMMLLVILTPQSVTKPTETAQVIVEIVQNQKADDPFIVCSWMGGPAVEEGRRILKKANIPIFNQPDVAARVLGLLRKQKRLAENIVPLKAVEKNQVAHDLIKKLRGGSKVTDEESKTITLSEHDSKTILKSYGLRTTGSFICSDLSEISKCVSEVGGYPVVMKIHGGKFTHKSDIGGVQLNLKTIEEAQKAFQSIKANYIKLDPEGFEGVTIQPMIGSGNSKSPASLTKHDSSPELIMGCVYDPQFGPMIMFGTGGTYVEVFNDTAITLCPIGDKEQAAEIVKKTAISKAILADGSKGERFAKVDPNHLYNTMIQFSNLCADLKDDLLECEMNPLIITKDDHLLALDARIIISK